jgi:sigma-B regulation protein RsbU (phosphoserine phosphatase)
MGEDSMKSEITLISSINKKINSGMILPDLLESIMDVAKELVHSEGSSLLLTDPLSGDLVFNVVVGEKGDIIQGQRVPRGMGIAGTVAETGKAVMVNDVQNDPRFFSGIDQQTAFQTRNILCLPMIVMDEMVGVLEIVNARERTCFDESDFLKAQYIADQAALAITNRRLYDNLTKRIDELSALYTISQAVAQSTSEEDILDRIIESLAISMEVERASIVIFDKAAKKMVIAASHGIPDHVRMGYSIDPVNSIVGHVFTTGKPLIANDIDKDEKMHVLTRDKDYKTGSFISIPILYKNKIMGVLSLTDKRNREKFDSFDLRVLTTASSQIAETYQNIQNRKFSEIQKRLSREIEIASEIQKKILPAVPEIHRGHFLAAYNRPAKEVGGDFFDFFKCDEKKYAVLVADISGKGIPAAIFMGSARNIIRAEMNVDTMPSRLLKNINRLIHRESEFGMFVTIFYAVIDSHNNIVTYGSGGHDDQLLIKKKTREAVKLNSKGTALGIVEDRDYEEKVALFEPGDMLVMYTDGVIECLGGKELDVEKGGERLVDIALKHLDGGPQSLIDHLKRDLDNTLVDRDFRDDFTIFAIQF